MTETELWNWMMDGNYPTRREGETFLAALKRRERRRATAVLKKDITIQKWRGHGSDPAFEHILLVKGTPVKVVMASRLGHVGITDDMKAWRGYHHCITCTSGRTADGYEFEPDDILTNIRPCKNA